MTEQRHKEKADNAEVHLERSCGSFNGNAVRVFKCLESNVILKELVRRGGKNLRETTRDPSPRASSQDDIEQVGQQN